MVSRITPYVMRGVLYYQGESDDHRPFGYAALLRSMIEEWRRDSRDAQLPFLLVQLPMYAVRETLDCDHWAQIREAQEAVYRSVKHTGLACIPDLGEFNEIHPKEKKTPAHRLYLQALREVYGLQEQGTTSPMVREAYPSGDGIRVEFDNVDNGLMLHGEGGFELCDAAGNWHAAKAHANENSVFVHSKQVPHPTGVRYAWFNFGQATLFEQNGLPAAPFRVTGL